MTLRFTVQHFGLPPAPPPPGKMSTAGLVQAVNYVNLYGESCLNDPETPSFVRSLMAKRAENELPRAG
jgi:hypothetical protein